MKKKTFLLFLLTGRFKAFLINAIVPIVFVVEKRAATFIKRRQGEYRNEVNI